MIVGVVIDQQGRPICSEMWPGNTADVTTLIPVVDRLRGRFGIGRVCVVADRGMISAATIAALEERGLEYILGVRERNSKEVRDVVLADTQPSVPLVIPAPRPARHRTAGQGGRYIDGRRYIVCRNRTRPSRMPATARPSWRRCAPSSSRATRRWSATAPTAAIIKTPDAQHFAIDEARVAEEARYDGLYVLRTNTRLHPLQAMLRYRELLVVEQMFRSDKDLLETRPIYHQTDAAIRGHVFCSFPGAGAAQGAGGSTGGGAG